jgi:peptidoglycan/xylan/chitin deacetylase (PgdA/CDA1 family)
LEAKIMIGPVTFKCLIKHLAGCAAALLAPCVPRGREPAACILVYHRVAEIHFGDSCVDNWNVSPAAFEKQIASLAGFAEFVPLRELPNRLASSQPSKKPFVCLTFDDAFANFFSRALPVLERYAAPVTVFAVTSAIGQRSPMPFDQWSQRNGARVSSEAWRPMNWSELEACADSGLVTIGAHSHRHYNALACNSAQLREEAEVSFAILKDRLGDAFGKVYSYPYGSVRLGQVPPDYVQAVRRAGFELAVTTNLGMASAISDRFLLPRIEAHGLDSSAIIQAKARGVLLPYRITDRLRRGRRFVCVPQKTIPSCPPLVESKANKRVEITNLR